MLGRRANLLQVRNQLVLTAVSRFLLEHLAVAHDLGERRERRRRVFAVDLGFSPRVDDLYGCSGGAVSSVVAACPDAVVVPTGRLAAQAPEQAVTTVGMIGAAVDDAVLWLPIGVVPERSFLRPGRVVTAPASNAAGGPLAGHDVELDRLPGQPRAWQLGPARGSLRAR